MAKPERRVRTQAKASGLVFIGWLLHKLRGIWKVGLGTRQARQGRIREAKAGLPWTWDPSVCLLGPLS